jgi:hypothetical protein
MTTGRSCPVDYATQLPQEAHHASKKPIKNMELAGSADTCIGTTSGARTQRAPLTAPSQADAELGAAKRRQIALRRAPDEVRFEVIGRKTGGLSPLIKLANWRLRYASFFAQRGADAMYITCTTR